MRLVRLTFLCLAPVCFAFSLLAQSPLTEFQTFAGQFGFTFFGSSNNNYPNNEPGFSCTNNNLSSTSALLTLPAGATGIVKAYLYWSGSGTGDWEIKLSGPNGLNQTPISAGQTFTTQVLLASGLQTFFSARADVTDILIQHGAGQYTVSELDADRSANFCPRSVYSGWAILVIYESPALPLTTVKIFEGFKDYAFTTVNFALTGLQIMSPQNTKLGLLAWEGDDQQAFSGESVSVNGNKLVNALNPSGHLFNGSNAFSNLPCENMDLDSFDIGNFVPPGTTSLDIQVKLGGDLVFLNLMVVSYNELLPDATVRITKVETSCTSPDITIYYTVFNDPLANGILQAGYPVGFYAGPPANVFLGAQVINNAIVPGDSLQQSFVLTIPDTLPSPFPLIAIVDDGDVITELNETNNTFGTTVSLPSSSQTDQYFTICDGDSLIWNNQVFTAPVAQDFTFVSQYGCDSIVHLQVDVLPRSTARLDTGLCQGQSLLLPNGDTISAPGDYEILLTAANGCDSTLSIHVTKTYSNQALQIAGDSIVKLGDDLHLSAIAEFEPDSIAWHPAGLINCPDCAEVIATIYQDTTITVEVFDSLACLISAQMAVKVLKPDKIFAPNVFSPNGDGLNEHFKIFAGRDVEAIQRLEIYDRWGNRILSRSGAYQSEWDGRFRGKRMPPGVYIWVARIRFKDGREKTYTGDVTLIR